MSITIIYILYSCSNEAHLGVAVMTNTIIRENIYFNGFQSTPEYEAGAIVMNNPSRRNGILNSIEKATFGFDDNDAVSTQYRN